MFSSLISPSADGCIYLKLFLFALMSKSTLCVVYSGLDEMEYYHEVGSAVGFVLERVICLVTVYIARAAFLLFKLPSANILL